METNDWPDPNEGSKPYLELGDGHSLTWTRYEGEICGGIIRHDKSDSPTGYCDGAFWLRGSKFIASEPNRPQRDLSGGFECPTLSPSFLCYCGDHGWIREGKWVRA